MLVTVEDLQNYMDIGKLSPRAVIGVGFILESLESELEQYLGRPIEVGVFTEDYRLLRTPTMALSPFYEVGSPLPLNPGYYTISVRKSPVLAVISVWESMVGGASTQIVADVDYGVRRFGIDVWNPIPDANYTITYRAGLNGVDYPVLKGLILRAAAREAQNMYDDNKGIQELDLRSATVNITGFTDSELKSVKRLRRQRF